MFVMQDRSRSTISAVGVLAVLVTISSCSQAPTPAEPAAPVNPLQGVWSTTSITSGGDGQTIDPSQPGLYIFTKGHYSAIYSLGNEPRSRSAATFDPTSEEKIAQFDTIIVNSGTYDVSGSTITFRPLVAKSPAFVGGQATVDFQIDGDMLTLTMQSVVAADGTSLPDAPGSSMTLRRVE